MIIETKQWPIATTTVKGKVELATDAEAAAGTATDKALVPKNLAQNLPVTGTTSTTFQIDSDAGGPQWSHNAGTMELLDSAGTSLASIKVRNITVAGSVLMEGGDIGTAGAAGFGVGVCPTAELPSGMTPLSGYNVVGSSNYGNYQYSDGSIMVFIPKFYYKISTNSVDVKGINTYASTGAANADGYALHRAFIDGGAEKSGFFVDKYECSKNAKGAGYIASSIANANPISTHADHNPIADLTACAGNYYYEAINAAHARDGVDGAVNAASIFHVTSLFQHKALAMLSLAHGQAATSTTNCAWYDGTGAMNYPKGNNNTALADTDDATVTYTSDGYSNCGKTGSGSAFAKTTHNGQTCGVADLNGNMWEISLGMTCVATSPAIEAMTQASPCQITVTGHGLSTGAYIQVNEITQADWSGCKNKIWQITYVDDNNFTIAFDASGFATPYDAGTDPGTITKGTFYVAKQATAMADFTSGATGATDHWGATGVAAMMDAITPAFESGGGFAQPMGSGANQVLAEDISGDDWVKTGAGLPLDANSIDTTGTNQFGKDYYYQYIRDRLCPLSGGYWNGTSGAGVWCANLYYYRTYSDYVVGFRCACYP